MESYKLVNSGAMKEKCEALGLDRDSSRWKISDPFLFIFGEIMTYSSLCVYDSHKDYKEITQADFLALPEPLKVGDWVRNGGLKRFGISQIFSIQDNKINTVKSDVDDSERFLDIKDCTKLTPEQIKVLGLEE